MARIAVVGSYGTGLTLRVPRIPEQGETIVGGPFEIHAGGKGSNQAVCAARLGAQVDFLTAVGSDPFAEEALRLWREEGVNARPAVREGHATMAGVILVEDDGHNRIAIAPGALDTITPETVDTFAQCIGAADVLLVQLEIPVDAARHALQLAREAGVTTVFNPAPARSVDRDTLALADFLTPNEVEAATLTGMEGSPEELAARLLEVGVGTVVVTLGERGALLATREGARLVPAFSVQHVVDTTGAGDAFSAALAVSLASGNDPAEAVRWGCAAGAAAVQHWGVVPALPRQEELATILWGHATAAAD